jgi:16S rRNA (adenine1518-N6/adenine1519-N6)-dimethyltransferase
VGRGPDQHRARKSLGQNFLVDPNLQRKIVAALGAGPDDEVLEIGPGRGALTRHLAGTVRRLVLAELDDVLAGNLVDAYEDDPSVEVVHGDVLELDRAAVLEDPAAALVVGNIPYNITTPIVFHLLERPRPSSIVLMVQDEVADRLIAEVGTKTYGALSVGVRSIARVEKLFRVRRGAFRPVPGVDSAVVRITPLRPPPLSAETEAGLRVLVRACFQWRRKQLGKILRDHPDLNVPPPRVGPLLEAIGARPEDRPERISPGGFVALARGLSPALD